MHATASREAWTDPGQYLDPNMHGMAALPGHR